MRVLRDGCRNGWMGELSGIGVGMSGSRGELGFFIMYKLPSK